MKKKRRFTSEKKIEILREYLENQIPISELADKYDVAPTMIYQWKKQMFEGALETFDNRRKGKTQSERKIKGLEGKLKDRNNVIVEIIAENVALKKSLNGDT